MIRHALHLLLTVSLVLSGSVIVQAASYTFVPIDFSGGVFGTVPVGINNEDDIVGSWTDSNIWTAFLMEDGVFRSIRPPGAFISVAFISVAFGINDKGEIVGSYEDVGGVTHGFFLEDGVLSLIDVPGAPFTGPSGINDHGHIVGAAGDHGFLLKDGVFSLIDVPGARSTTATRINKRGQIIGRYYEVNSLTSRGFLLENGIFRLIDVPGTSFTNPLEINNRGQILVVSDGHSFFLKGGIFSQIDIDFDVPGPSGAPQQF